MGFLFFVKKTTFSIGYLLFCTSSLYSYVPAKRHK